MYHCQGWASSNFFCGEKGDVCGDSRVKNILNII